MKITSIFIRTIAGIVAWCCLIPQVTKAQMNAEKQVNPVILYSGNPKSYEIGGIAVSGVKNYEDYVLIGLSGLSVGQKVQIPGDDITNATKRYWKQDRKSVV